MQGLPLRDPLVAVIRSDTILVFGGCNGGPSNKAYTFDIRTFEFKIKQVNRVNGDCMGFTADGNQCAVTKHKEVIALVNNYLNLYLISYNSIKSTFKVIVDYGSSYKPLDTI